MSGAPSPARAQLRAGGKLVRRDVVGWREWVALPDLAIGLLAAKIDTGARTSALHAVDLEPFRRGGARWVRFRVPEEQAPYDGARPLHAVPVRDVREVRSSIGEAERRYVIATTLRLAARHFQVEVTLSDRSEMEYPMLIGRSALRTARLLVHPSRSFLQGRPRA